MARRRPGSAGRAAGGLRAALEGLALDRDGNHGEAAVALTRAANVRAELGRPEIDENKVFRGAAAPKPTTQAGRVVAAFRKSGARALGALQGIPPRLAYGPDTRPAEAAMQELGDLLGLETDRPDSRLGTGPDVVWREPERRTCAALKLKADKKADSMYTKKDDIGQYQDHARFMAEAYPDDRVLHRIVGPPLPVSPESHPPTDLEIMQVEPFHAIVPRLATVYRALGEATGAEALDVVAQRWLDHLGLRWPTVLTAMPSDAASDLQRVEPEF